MMMQLLIEQTAEVATLDGVQCRRWEGTGPDGSRFAVWVHRLTPLDPRAVAYVEDHLSPVDPPRRIDPVTVQLTRDQLAMIVSRWIVDVEGEASESRSMNVLARAVKSAYEDGEPAVAYALILLIYARSAGRDAEALAALSLGLGRIGVGPYAIPIEAVNAGLPTEAAGEGADA